MPNYIRSICGAGGGGGCFPAHVTVETPKGEVSIAYLTVGDIVIAFDDSGNKHERKITAKFEHPDEMVYDYSIWGGVTLPATPNHWVVNQYNTFAAIGSLTQNDMVVDTRGHLRPVLSSVCAGRMTVYNFHVDEFHTFVANGIRVHNGGINASIRGAGGGGGGGKGGGGTSGAVGFREDKNNLRSKSTARVLEVVSIGPIRGLVDGAKSIYIDKTPAMNASGEMNFKGLTWDFRPGTMDQEIIAGFDSVRTEASVGAAVTNKFPVVRRIDAPEATAIIIKVSLPNGLKKQLTEGENALVGSSVQFRVDVSTSGGPYITMLDREINGKTVSSYEEAYRLDIHGGGPWEVKVLRITADTETATEVNDISWSSYTIVTDVRLNYPGIALMGYVVDSQEFGNQLPDRWVDMYGIFVQVPTNYNPETREYTGLWDGTFKLAWSDNPAWLLWWLITDTENGLGESIPAWASSMSKMEIYQISKYCDELVPNGYGGFEPRFTFNGWMAERQKGFDYLRLICGAFRTQVFWGQGYVGFKQDAPQPISRTFTQANVIGGRFTYGGVGLSARHSVAYVAWNNPDDFCRQDIEVVEDGALIQKIGFKPMDIPQIGCTSRGQAHRAGAMALLSEETETSMVDFSIGIAECNVTPGQIVGISDAKYALARCGGRCVAIEPMAVSIDAPRNFNRGEAYSITLTTAQGTLETVDIEPISGEHYKLPLKTPIQGDVRPGAIYAITSVSVSPRPFRILSITENGPLNFKITALLHNPGKYDQVEKGIIFDPPPYSNIPTGDVLPPSGLRAEEYIYSISGLVKSGVVFAWLPPDDVRVQYYEVEIVSPIEPQWLPMGIQTGPSVDMKDSMRGEWKFRVRAISGFNSLKSGWVEQTFWLYGVDQPLPDVENFASVYVAGKMNLVWDMVKDPRPVGYEVRMGETWDAAQIVGVISTNMLTIISGGVYWVKAVSGTAYSVNATGLEVEGPMGLLTQNVIACFNADDYDWIGGYDNVFKIPGGIQLDASGIYSSTDIYSEQNIYFAGYTGEPGIYTIPEDKWVTLDVPQMCGINCDYRAFGTSRTANMRGFAKMRSVQKFRGLINGSYSVHIEISVRREKEWGKWTRFMPASYSGDGFRFRAILSTTNTDVLVFLTMLNICVDVPDRRLSFTAITIPKEGLLLPFRPKFNAKPLVVCTILDATGGEDAIVDSNSVTIEGVFIKIHNTAGQPIEKLLNVYVEGY